MRGASRALQSASAECLLMLWILHQGLKGKESGLLGNGPTTLNKASCQKRRVCGRPLHVSVTHPSIQVGMCHILHHVYSAHSYNKSVSWCHRRGLLATPADVCWMIFLHFVTQVAACTPYTCRCQYVMCVTHMLSYVRSSNRPKSKAG